MPCVPLYVPLYVQLLCFLKCLCINKFNSHYNISPFLIKTQIRVPKKITSLVCIIVY
ncbi:Orf102 [Heliothis zea nudivirus]|uniref:Orf102 n=1 Tax=Heliothis zea nudivirus 1 TaxID=3116536 RepID=Q8JKL1_9VIRU|nr:Orf102 [Heliothis zea nudivirus]AAN04396.1 Orf102 [Heliothis zea nudivirus]